MDNKNLFISALIGAAVMVVLSNVPVLSLITACYARVYGWAAWRPGGSIVDRRVCLLPPAREPWSVSWPV